MIKISFCTTCKGRLWQLEQTLPHNLSMLRNDCEIVLLDYQSPDKLRDYIFSNFEAELENGKLKYFYLNHDYNYTSSYAKNVAHKLATGDVLFNLDADNYIYDGLISELRTLTDSEWLIPRLHGNDEGSYGRLGYTRNTFYKMCGYNETIVGMKGDDGELNHRLLKAGYKPKYALQKTVAIQNTREQKDLYTNVEGLINPPVHYPDQWGKAVVLDGFGEVFGI